MCVCTGVEPQAVNIYNIIITTYILLNWLSSEPESRKILWYNYIVGLLYNSLLYIQHRNQLYFINAYPRTLTRYWIICFTYRRELY